MPMLRIKAFCLALCCSDLDLDGSIEEFVEKVCGFARQDGGIIKKSIFFLFKLDHAVMRIGNAMEGNMEKSQMKALLLDLGDTIVHVKAEKLDEASIRIRKVCDKPVSRSKLEKAILQEWNQRKSKEELEVIISIHDRFGEKEYLRDFFKSILENHFDIKNPDQGLTDWLAVMYSDPNSYICFPEVHDALRQFKAGGITLIVVSNAFPYAKEILKDLELKEQFDWFFLSYEIGSAKPDTEIYRFAISSIGFQPEEMVFVDDREAFVEAANQVKMDAYWINRNGSTEKAQSEIHTIKDLTELYPLFGIKSNKIMENVSLHSQYTAEPAQEPPNFLSRIIKRIFEACATLLISAQGLTRFLVSFRHQL